VRVQLFETAKAVPSVPTFQVESPSPDSLALNPYLWAVAAPSELVVQCGCHDLGIKLVFQHELVLIESGHLLGRRIRQRAKRPRHGRRQPASDRRELVDQCLPIFVLPESNARGLPSGRCRSRRGLFSEVVVEGVLIGVDYDVGKNWV